MEQKPRRNILIYIIIIILIIAIGAVYFVFFAPEKLRTNLTQTPITVNTAIEEVGKTATKTGVSLSLSSKATSTDVTGGLSSLKLTPESILNDPVFQSLHPYAEPVEVPILGRPNPFIPY